MGTLKVGLVETVLGQNKVDPSLLGPDEWYEILSRASGHLTLECLKGLRPLKAIIENIPLGSIPATADEYMVTKALQSVRMPDSARFLLVGDLLGWPKTVPGESQHILFSASDLFYHLGLQWDIESKKTPSCVLTGIVFLEIDLPDLLNAYEGPKLPLSILKAFRDAQTKTTKDLLEKYMAGYGGELSLESYLQVLE